MSTVYLLSWVTGMCALWLVWSLGWRRLALAMFRERLFELRSQLFRLGMTNELRFDDEAYRTLETLICGLLRFGHRITFLTYVFSMRELERAKKEKSYVDVGQQLALRVSRLQTETQKKIAELLVNVRSAIILYLVFSSLFFLAGCLAILVLKRLGFAFESDQKQKVTEVIEQEAYRTELRRPVGLAIA